MKNELGFHWRRSVCVLREKEVKQSGDALQSDETSRFEGMGCARSRMKTYENIKETYKDQIG